MLVVLDTSVLVAAFQSRRGASFRLLQLLRERRFQVAISVPLALEYESSLVRHAAELGFEPADAAQVVDAMCALGRHVEIHYLWRPALSDPRDEFVVELAVAAHCDAIVTHNIRNFEGAVKLGVRALTPAALLHTIGEKP